MKQLTIIFTAVLFFATGYLVGHQKSGQGDLINVQESRFVTFSQQANYKLAALKKIGEGKVSEAVGILKASLIVDESEMSNCGSENSRCDLQFKAAFKEYESKKVDYEVSSITE